MPRTRQHGFASKLDLTLTCGFPSHSGQRKHILFTTFPATAVVQGYHAYFSISPSQKNKLHYTFMSRGCQEIEMQNIEDMQ